MEVSESILLGRNNRRVKTRKLRHGTEPIPSKDLEGEVISSCFRGVTFQQYSWCTPAFPPLQGRISIYDMVSNG